MKKLRDLVREAPVHERRLEFHTYPIGNERLIVEGWLRDERLVAGYDWWDGRPRPTGVIHRMCVRLLVGGWPLTVLDAEVEMPGVPHDLCRTTLESVRKIIGLPIVSGFSDEVLKRLGGVNGCAHLTYLTVAIGPAALHGYWIQKSRQRHPTPRSLEECPALENVINSCKLWSEDGPLMHMIRDTLEKKGRKSYQAKSQMKKI